MGTSRRGFLGAAAAASGWFLIGRKAGAELKKDVLVDERDETWGDLPVHIIEASLTYDSPMVAFDIPQEPGPQESGLADITTKRLIVPRVSVEELREYHEGGRLTVKVQGEDGESFPIHAQYPEPKSEKFDLKGALRERMIGYTKLFLYQSGDAGKPYGTMLVFNCPDRTEIGMLVHSTRFTSKELHIMVPARLVFGG